MSVTIDDPEAYGLKRVGGRPPLGEYLRDVFRRRQFIISLARFRIEASNQQSRLGLLWVILRPLLNAAVFGFMFGILMKSLRSTPNFAEYLIIGVFLFEFFSGSLTAGSRSVIKNRALVQSLAFPRMVLPISVVTEKFFQLVPTMVLLVVLLAVFGHTPTLAWFLLIPLVIIYYFLMLGMVLITARLSVHIRDLVNLIPFITRFFFYSTGIFFRFEDRFADYPTVLEAVQYQPIYAILNLGRSILLNTDPIYNVNTFLWFVITGWAVVLVVFGVIFFWRAEERYGRVS